MLSGKSLIALSVFGVVAACGEQSQPQEPEVNASLRSGYATPYEVVAPEDLPPDILAGVQSGCTDDRIIVEVAEGSSCPDIDEWKVQPLVGGFCLYESDTAGDALTPTEKAMFADVHPDCVAVAPQRGSALEPVVGNAVRNAFARRVGFVNESDLAVGGASSEAFRSPVTVAVVDTVPRERTAQLHSEHGEDLARIVESLACPNVSSDDCAVTVARELGLPRIEHDEVDLVRGGYMGSFSDLARAIVESVDAWDDTGGLVINLSVGWEFGVFGGEHPGSEAVRAAVQYAYCHGALVVASAGNDGGLCQDGLLAPALLADAPAPDADRCDALGVASADQSLEGEAPLVYAIGGLGFGDDDMPAARVGAHTKLMATASHGMGGRAYLTTPLTGTSVSAAAASAAAAMVWSYNPDFTRAQVMDTLYQGGESLPFTADITAVTDVGPVPSRRVSICGAMDYACQQNPGCQLSLDCGLPTDVSDIDAIVEAAEQAATAFGPDLSFSQPEACGPSICGVELSTPTMSDCDRLSPDPVAPYADPQPGSTICSVCGVNGFVLSGSLDQHVSAAKLDEIVISVSTPWARSASLYSLGRPSFNRLGVLQMNVFAPGINDPNANVSIIGIMADGRTLGNPILSRQP